MHSRYVPPSPRTGTAGHGAPPPATKDMANQYQNQLHGWYSVFYLETMYSVLVLTSRTRFLGICFLGVGVGTRFLSSWFNRSADGTRFFRSPPGKYSVFASSGPGLFFKPKPFGMCYYRTHTPYQILKGYRPVRPHTRKTPHTCINMT